MAEDALMLAERPFPSMLSGDRQMPQNLNAEVAVLGCMLLKPDVAIDVANTKLGFAGSFYHPAHQQIFSTMVRLANEGSRGKIDLITLAAALRTEGKLEEIGGELFLIKVMNSVPTAANLEKYAQIVYEQAMLRRLIQLGCDIVDSSFDPQSDVRELLDRLEQEVSAVSSVQNTGEIVAVGDCIFEAVDYLERLTQRDDSVLGIQTGFPDLDKIIGGLRPTEMFVLAARPSIGKTALALNLVTNIALDGAELVPVGVFSLEMGTSQLVLRLLCSIARVNIGDIRDGAVSKARWHEIMEVASRLRKAPIFIDDTGGIDIQELRTKARRMHREHGVKLIVIDYLQLITTSGGNRNSTRENEVSKISSGIKTLAKELNIPIIVLAQLNRQAEQAGQRPKLGHLRESGAIEQDADVVALLHRDRDTDSISAGSEGRESELIIAKHRNGPTGLVPLTFLPQYTRFESRAAVSDEDVP